MRIVPGRGARETAKQMLNQLRNILENLAGSQQAPKSVDQNMMSSIKNLGELINKQRQLLDQTYQQFRGRKGQKSRKGNLSKQQKALQQMLGKIREQMKKHGMQPGQSLQQAQRAMEEARKSLEGQKLGPATEQQTHALDQLRKGAKSLAQQIFKQIGQQNRQNQTRSLWSTDQRRDGYGRQCSHPRSN